MDSEGYDIKLAENEINILEKVGNMGKTIVNGAKKLQDVPKLLDLARARKAHKFYWKSTKLMETVLDKVFDIK